MKEVTIEFNASLSTAVDAPPVHEANPQQAAGSLSSEMLDRMHRYWSAANYLTVGQICCGDFEEIGHVEQSEHDADEGWHRSCEQIGMEQVVPSLHHRKEGWLRHQNISRSHQSRRSRGGFPFCFHSENLPGLAVSGCFAQFS